MIALVLLSGFLGFAVKYIDEVFDEGRFSKSTAYLLGAIAIPVSTYLFVTDFYWRQLLLAIFLGVLFACKVDNRAFQIFFAATFGLGLAYHLTIAPLTINWLFVGTAALAGVLDELGNDTVDRYQCNCFVTSFFQHRWALKLLVLGFGWANLLPIGHVLAFLVFDGAYETVGSASELSIQFAIDNPQLAINPAPVVNSIRNSQFTIGN
ncbi:MAG: hypothetical protein KME17_20230 [Cyanosarcina radialis HA8281-LM2]|jgi:hypothetical protein|nr:hypothetical protein [Cyanosarcina radialis HA8281-LM2]